jgi:glycosyltransferase involved in cell wall biosynthesis
MFELNKEWKKKEKITYFVKWKKIKSNFQSFFLIKIIVIYIFSTISNKSGNFIIKNNSILFKNIKYQTNISNDIQINSKNNTFNIKENNTIKDEQSYYHNPRERIEAFEKGKRFFKLCMNKTLINNNTFTKEPVPFISVIIPVYSSEDKLWNCVRSVQNQNITNIEIVLVDDFSNNKTKDIIKQIMAEDPRILLINNKKNMGTLYSRCIGTLKSNGKYIFPLDNDDLFFDETILDTISTEAERGNFDIVEFKGTERYQFSIFFPVFKDSEYSNHQHNLILYQPLLGQYPRRKNNISGIYDCFLWAKCIKSDVYKKTVNSMGEEIYKYKIIWGEDLITSFVLFRIAKSFKFISKYGISRFKSKSTASSTTPSQLFYLSGILYTKVLLKFTQNNFFDKQLVADEVKRLLRSFAKLNSENKIYFKEVLKNVLNNNYISSNDKKIILYYYMKLNKYDSTFNQTYKKIIK